MEPQQPASATPVPRRRARFNDSSDEEERPLTHQRISLPQRRRTGRSNLPESQLAALRERQRISQALSRLRRTDEQRAADLARNAAAERERRARQTEEQQSTARQRNTTARRAARESLTNEQRSVIQVQDTAAHQDARNLSYLQRNFEERFEVDPEAALQKFRTMSGLQHLYKAKWKPDEFMSDINKGKGVE